MADTSWSGLSRPRSRHSCMTMAVQKICGRSIRQVGAGTNINTNRAPHAQSPICCMHCVNGPRLWTHTWGTASAHAGIATASGRWARDPDTVLMPCGKFFLRTHTCAHAHTHTHTSARPRQPTFSCIFVRQAVALVGRVATFAHGHGQAERVLCMLSALALAITDALTRRADRPN